MWQYPGGLGCLLPVAVLVFVLARETSRMFDGINLCSRVRAVAVTYTVSVILHTCINWHRYVTSLIGVNDASVFMVVTQYA